MKTKNDIYILTIDKGKEKTKLYYNNKLNVHEELNKEDRCVWYWIGMEIDEILPAYSQYKLSR